MSLWKKIQVVPRITGSLLAPLFLVMPLYGQQLALKGVLTDTFNHKSPAHAVIALLRKTDSTLTGFTRSTATGQFNIAVPSPGEFILLITHPSYDAMHRTVILLTDTSMGVIVMQPRSHTMEEVVVKQRRPALRIRGDTLEYNAGNITVKQNADAEELLRQLPGITVGRNGEITAQGEKVQKVLVDGEEFFGDDPTIATRHLRADMIDKVQVLNKKSPQAEFTGIDDGSKIKTLNLTLKEAKKRGYFAKAAAGTDFSKYYNATGMISGFKGKRQLSAFGNMANDGQPGLTGMDISHMGQGEMVYVPADNAASEGLGVLAQGGIPRTWNGGFHYSNKWNDAAQHLNTNYRYNRITLDPVSSTLIQDILQDAVYTQNQHNASFSRKEQHYLSGIYDATLDSFSSVRISVGGRASQDNIINIYDAATLKNSQQVNTSYRKTTSDGHNEAAMAAALWRKKFRYPGQTLSVNIVVHANDNHTDGFLYAINQFYTNGSQAAATDTVDQKKQLASHTVTGETNIMFTQPLWKDVVMGLSYYLSFINQSSFRNAYNKGPDKYDQYVDSLSNNYSLHVLTQRGSLNIQVNHKKLTYTVGGDISQSAYRQRVIAGDSSFQYRFVNFFPRLSLRYNKSLYRSINISYNGNTQAPSVYQLQPVKNNNDPLNVTLGNPDLKPAFRHYFNISWNDFKMLASQYFYVGINGGFTNNNFSSRTYIDTLGRKVSQAVNVNGSMNAMAYMSYSRRLGKVPLDIGFQLSADFNRTINFVNLLQNRNDNYNYSAGINLGRNKVNRYNFSIRSVIILSRSTSSVNRQAAIHYYTHEHAVLVGVNLPWNTEVNTDCWFSFRERINASDINNEAIRWNAYADKKLFNNNLVLRVLVNDILNRNIGFSRYVSANQLTESSFTVLPRYWMLSVIWNFSNQGKVRD